MPMLVDEMGQGLWSGLMATNPVLFTQDSFGQTSYGEWSLAHAPSLTSPGHCLQAQARTDQKYQNHAGNYQYCSGPHRTLISLSV